MAEPTARPTRAPRGSSVRILTPFSPDEAQAVREAARKANMETSAWLRLQALAGLERS